MDLFPPDFPQKPKRETDETTKMPPTRSRPQNQRGPSNGADEQKPYAPLTVNHARLERQRLKKRRRRIRMAVVVSVALACVLVYFTGLYGTSIALLGDLTDSVVIALTPGGGFPLEMNMEELTDVQPLAGGFAALDGRELTMWSASGKELRRVQHGYSEPCITTGNTRVCIYDRGSNALRVEGRRSTLSDKTNTLKGNAILAEMSPNGTLAVFTDKGLEVYDPMFNLIWYWNRTDALPLAMAFDSGNRKFAAALVESRGGVLSSTVYLFETGKSEAIAEIQADDAMPVAMKYLSSGSLLCVFDTRAVIYDTATGQQTASYEYGTRVLQSVSTGSGLNTVLLFSDVDTSRHAEVIVLDETLSEAGRAELNTRSLRVASDRTGAYVMTDDSVVTFALDGTLCGETLLDETPQRIVCAGKLYLFAGDTAFEFTPPGKPAEGASPAVTDLREDSSEEQAQSGDASSSTADASASAAAQ